MVKLWAELERWSAHRQRGRLGNFRLLRLGNLAHVSIPQAQAILTDAERQRLPALFAVAGLTPDTPLPAERLRQVLIEFGSAHLDGRTMRPSARAVTWQRTCSTISAANSVDGTAWRRMNRPTTVALPTPPKDARIGPVLEPRNGRLTPRMRFETTLEDASEEIRYCGGFRVQDLFGTPSPGWSSPVSDQTGRLSTPRDSHGRTTMSGRRMVRPAPATSLRRPVCADLRASGPDFGWAALSKAKNCRHPDGAAWQRRQTPGPLNLVAHAPAAGELVEEKDPCPRLDPLSADCRTVRTHIASSVSGRG